MGENYEEFYFGEFFSDELLRTRDSTDAIRLRTVCRTISSFQVISFYIVRFANGESTEKMGKDYEEFHFGEFFSNADSTTWNQVEKEEAFISRIPVSDLKKKNNCKCNVKTRH